MRKRKWKIQNALGQPLNDTKGMYWQYNCSGSINTWEQGNELTVIASIAHIIVWEGFAKGLWANTENLGHLGWK